MKKILFILFVLIMVLPVSFSQNITQNGPFKEMCEQFKLLNNTNISIMPTEAIDELNQAILKANLSSFLNAVNNTVFSAEMRYNKSLCFAGSFKFLDGEIEYLKFIPDPFAGQNESHITFMIELSNFDDVATTLMELNFDNFSGNTIKVILTTIGKLIKSFFSGDISIKPISGLVKVFKALFIFTKLNFEKISSVIN